MIRERTDADLVACARLVEAVRNVDGYPPSLAGGDFTSLFTVPRPIVAYVATGGDDVVGHVALHSETNPLGVRLACEALGLEPVQLGVVARLFCAVDRRREGIGRALLAAATDAARSRGLVPILDVWVELRPAVALYESAGWRRLGTLTYALDTGPHDVDVFAAPS